MGLRGNSRLADALPTVSGWAGLARDKYAFYERGTVKGQSVSIDPWQWSSPDPFHRQSRPTSRPDLTVPPHATPDTHRDEVPRETLDRGHPPSSR